MDLPLNITHHSDMSPAKSKFVPIPGKHVPDGVDRKPSLNHKCGATLQTALNITCDCVPLSQQSPKKLDNLTLQLLLDTNII